MEAGGTGGDARARHACGQPCNNSLPNGLRGTLCKGRQGKVSAQSVILGDSFSILSIPVEVQIKGSVIYA